MDFRIDTANGRGEMTFEPVENIMNNIYLSIKVRQGSCFWNPMFGMRDIRPAKNTDDTASRLRDYAKEALQWLIDCGRARSVDVTVERDPEADPYRMKILIEAVQSDGSPASFMTYQGVI